MLQNQTWRLVLFTVFFFKFTNQRMKNKIYWVITLFLCLYSWSQRNFYRFASNLGGTTKTILSCKWVEFCRGILFFRQINEGCLHINEGCLQINEGCLEINEGCLQIRWYSIRTYSQLNYLRSSLTFLYSLIVTSDPFYSNSVFPTVRIFISLNLFMFSILYWTSVYIFLFSSWLTHLSFGWKHPKAKHEEDGKYFSIPSHHMVFGTFPKADSKWQLPNWAMSQAATSQRLCEAIWSAAGCNGWGGVRCG